MDYQIRITPETMHSRGNEFTTAREEFNAVRDTMTKLIATLQEEWEGNASRKFAEQYESLSPAFNNMNDLIATIAQQCHDVADAMQTLDDDIASKFS